jgi:DNA-binding PadR family transcriptional regulator
MLAEQPLHGYELMRRREDRSGAIYRASAGYGRQIYRFLKDNSG